jgi:BNR/Asp-box repeat
MPTPSILVATWENGLFCVTGKVVRQELANQSVCGLVADGCGSVLAVVGGHSLCRRSADGEWTTIAKSEFDLSCCVAIGNVVFVGTNDARMLRLDADGRLHRLTGFDAAPGRETWYAGSAIIDGRRMGPPLGIRSVAATCDGAVLLANVHVGGIPRSTDGGITWQPTIHIDSDVHQVSAHPTASGLVVAAAAEGLCMSHDAGVTWTIEQRGLHAHHCSAVVFGRYDIFVSAATDPFTKQGAVYRRPIASDGPLQPVGGGLPEWTSGSADTNCIATWDSMVALIDRSGRLYVSHDDGATWSSPLVDLLALASGLHIG